MKILQVSHGFPPKENAGVELYTLHLSKALTELNHQVVLFCRGDDPGREEFSTYEEAVQGLRVIRAVNRLTQVDSPRVLYDNHFVDKPFVNVLEREKPDLVHFQHLFGLSAHLVRLAKREGVAIAFTLHDYFTFCHRIQLLKRDGQLCQGPRYGLECVSCLETGLPDDLRTRMALRLKDVLPFPIIKWTKRFFLPPRYLEQKRYEAFHRYRYMYEVFKACDILLTPSRYVKDFFIRYYGSMEPKIKALPLGIPPFQRRAVPAKRKEKIRFCYTGTVSFHKGLHVLVDAFGALPGGRAVLTIYGARASWNQDYYDELKRKATGLEVHFRGAYQREDLPELLSEQDVVVLPPIWPETFSIVIREANMLGLPVIASRIGAIPEAVEEGINGYLFEPGNREDLQKCMLRFIEAPALIQEMASKMASPKSMAEHALEMAQIYGSLLGRKQ